jgi:adenylate cyclase
MGEKPPWAEVELTLLFADVRGSTGLAEELGPREFAGLMQRFYRASTREFIDSDAFLDKPVGDEVIALYFPLWGADHAAKGIRAAQNLLRETGHADLRAPWISVGAGVHTGLAYVGTVVVEGKSGDYDVTALGDAVNVTSQLAPWPRPGRSSSARTLTASGLDLGDPPRRTLELEGRSEPLEARVLPVAPAPV